ncbi:MAG: formylglycine-generating enzyme family protein, partial [Elainellaceae cyanobacterium]
ICQKLRESAMQPKIYAFDQGFKIFIAKAPIHDPKLRYRKEVEAIATRGKLSVVGRYMLDELRHKLGLAAADADAIEDAVLRPQRDYEKNCRTYRQAVQAALAQDPVSDRTWDELSRLQTLLGLSDEDETQIRGEIQGQLQPDGADRPAPCSTPPSPEEAADLERITYVTATVSLARSGPLGLGKLTPQVKQRSHTTEGFNEMLADGVGLVLIQIPAGQFLMGSSASEKGHWDTEGPEHTVTLAPFLMGQTAVTQAQWRAVAAYPKISVDLLPAASAQGDSHPVEQISWPEAVEFCQRLSRHTGRRYRLPSEAEWEYACRAGTVTPFHCGAMLTPELAHYGSAAQTRENPIEVGSFPANAFGLYDMHGNVWEWCSDRWHESYEGAPSDGSVWTTQRPEDDDDRRVIRGGSWMDHPSACRSAARIGLNSETQSSDLGFRVVCER